MYLSKEELLKLKESIESVTIGFDTECELATAWLKDSDISMQVYFFPVNKKYYCRVLGANAITLFNIDNAEEIFYIVMRFNDSKECSLPVDHKEAFLKAIGAR